MKHYTTKDRIFIRIHKHTGGIIEQRERGDMTIWFIDQPPGLEFASRSLALSMVSSSAPRVESSPSPRAPARPTNLVIQIAPLSLSLELILNAPLSEIMKATARRDERPSTMRTVEVTPSNATHFLTHCAAQKRSPRFFFLLFFFFS